MIYTVRGAEQRQFPNIRAYKKNKDNYRNNYLDKDKRCSE